MSRSWKINLIAIANGLVFGTFAGPSFLDLGWAVFFPLLIPFALLSSFVVVALVPEEQS